MQIQSFSILAGSSHSSFQGCHKSRNLLLRPNHRPPTTLTHKTNGPVEIKLVLVEKVMLEVWKTFAVERKRCWKLRNFKFRSRSCVSCIFNKNRDHFFNRFLLKTFPSKRKIIYKILWNFPSFRFYLSNVFQFFLFFIKFFRAVFSSSRTESEPWS